MAYSLYTTFENTVVTRDDQLEAEQLAVTVLEAAYPTLDLRSGSGLYDIVVRPTATLLAMIGKSSEQFITDNRIDGITDETSTDVVDSLLSNFFIERNSGQKAQVLVRVKFATTLPTDSVTVSSSTYFSSDNVNKYIPITTYYLTKNQELTLYTSISESYWYADILCESETEGTQYNIPGGTEFTFFSIPDPYFIGAVCLSVVQQSINTETNTEFVARAPEAISTRNLINNVSIPARLNQEFNYIKDIAVSGYGDYEQYRDYKEIPSAIPGRVIPFHIGGHVDVYVNTPIVKRNVQVTTDSAGRVIITGVDPIIRIAPATAAASSTLTGAPLQTTNLVTAGDVAGFVYEDLNYTQPGFFYEKEYGYSSKQNIILYRTGTPLPADSSFDIEVLQYENISSIQSYLDDSNNRVVSGDYVARGYNVVDLQISIYAQGSVSVSQDTINSIIDTASAYCDSKAGGAFTVAELLTEITPMLSEYVISSNVYVNYVLYNGITTTFPPTGVANYNGVIDQNTVMATPGHDEASARKVGNKYIFRVNSLEVIGI